jgi:hypothetical protein
MRAQTYHKQPKTEQEDVGKTILEALQGLNKYLATINGRLEVMLLSYPPEYIRADLINLYQAEQEASQIVRHLNCICHKSF